MKKTYFAIAIFFAAAFLHFDAKAQNEELKYRRSSLYSIMVSHPDQKMDEEIIEAFMALETPEKYNNHDLSIKCISTYSKKAEVKDEIDLFLKQNQVAKRLVSKWFNRNKQTGGFDPALVMERGLYDVSAIDIEAAAQSKRGIDALADRGYELIENTYVIVNDITYVDHEKNAEVATGILSIIGAAATIITGDENNIVTSAATLGAIVSSLIAGFTVNIHTHLYQLEWNDRIADRLYTMYYYDKPATDSASLAAFEADENLRNMKAAYEADDSTFVLKYVGSYKEKSAKPVLRGLYSPEDVFRKVCARAVDKNISALQKKFDQFKVKVPLTGIEPLSAQIGMKEGVSPKSKYEVLMPEIDAESGKVKYIRKGVIQPIPGKIWDNRYMATEERAEGANLKGTEFKVLSGSNFTQGMLIREMK